MQHNPIFSLGRVPGTVLSCIFADAPEPVIVYGSAAQRAWDTLNAKRHDPWAHERTETMSVMVWRAVHQFWENNPERDLGLRVFECGEFFAVPDYGQDMLDMVWRALRNRTARKLDMHKDAEGRVHVGEAA